MGKISAKARWVEGYQLITDNSRTHSFVCDLPVAAGGTDKGPTPLEVALMSLAGCAVVIYTIIAENSKIELTSLEAVAEAEKPEGSSKLAKVRLNVKVAANARKRLLETVWRKTEDRCPVLQIFREPVPAETKLEIRSTTNLSSGFKF